MKNTDKINKILWDNLSRLMIVRYGKESINKTSVESGKTCYSISLGTIARIKAQETEVGIRVIDTIAHFFGVDAAYMLTDHSAQNNNKTQHILDNFKDIYDDADKVHQAIVLNVLKSLEETKHKGIEHGDAQEGRRRVQR